MSQKRFWGKQIAIIFARFHRSFAALLLLVILNVLFPAQASNSADKFTFDLTVSGLENDVFNTIHKTFKEASLLEMHQQEPFTSVANLRRQLKSDVDLMQRVLRANGYYGSRIEDSIARQEEHFKVRIKITPGPLYHFKSVTVAFQYPEPKEDIRNQINELVGLNKDDPAIAQSVVSAEARITDTLPEFGFPFAERIQRDIIVDHNSQSMDVTFIVATGIERHMGKLQFNGLETIKDVYLRKFATWEIGDTFKQSLIDDLRSRLVRSGLFASVNITLVPAEDESANIIVTLNEAKQRTIGITGGYSTAEGFGGDISWTHRNLTGRGDRLRLTLLGAEIEQSLAAQYELPNFRRLDQILSFEGAVRRQDTDAFLSNSLEAGTSLERVITDELAIHAGLTTEYNDIRDAEGDRDFFLAGLPLGLRWDSSDDLLDPRQGIRASFTTTPNIGVGDNTILFLRNELRTSAYYSPSQDEKLTGALRIRLGSIVGAANADLPATERFFSGGGGSIRGFKFQRVGPLDIEGDPLGGRSTAEVGAEVRWKVSRTIGIVPFIDGGNVYEDVLPQFSGFRWGAGLGLRYHTSIGPIRFDAAFPLGRRPEEKRFQFYISLGQAF
ncbi:MAG: autotransporter assembly complex family protein [Sphingomonadales bacterium]